MTTSDESEPAATARPRRLGCVSFLNAKPLIEGLDQQADPLVHFDVPSRLLADLEEDRVDLALCPVIDYQRSRLPLVIVPAGGIGCAGPTLTVVLRSRVPFEQIDTVHADNDSHTSVALLQIVLWQHFSRAPRIVPFTPPTAGDQQASVPGAALPGAGAGGQAMLLIGDKVVTTPHDGYPYRMDLGQAWHELTGMPFLFAVWMARAGRELGDLPQLLVRTRQANAGRIDAIAARYAPRHGFPLPLAQQYLSQMLRFEVGPAQLQAAEHFFNLAHQLHLIPALRPLQVLATV